MAIVVAESNGTLDKTNYYERFSLTDAAQAERYIASMIASPLPGHRRLITSVERMPGFTAVNMAEEDGSVTRVSIYADCPGITA